MSNCDLTIVIPTFNEAHNVRNLYHALNSTLEIEESLEYLFVDDSTDELTREIIEELAQEDPRVRFIFRETNSGLATAIAEGMEAARGDYVCSMDADLQHPPQYINDLYRAVRFDGADIAVGSRYTNNGSAQGLTTFYRRISSHICRYAAYALLPSTRKTTDPGSGFYMTTKKAVDAKKLGRMFGYKILIEILVRNPELKVADVGYTFVGRQYDISKSTFRQGLLYFKHIVLLALSQRRLLAKKTNL